MAFPFLVFIDLLAVFFSYRISFYTLFECMNVCALRVRVFCAFVFFLSFLFYFLCFIYNSRLLMLT